MKIPYIVNPRIVRGLDYYTNTAFEFINNNLGSQNALGGGGRYNGLVEQFGGKPTPGIGFAGGITRLLLSLEQEQLFMGKEPRPDFYFIGLGDKVTAKAIEIISFLRNNHFNVEYDIERGSMKSQLKQANKLGTKIALILGEDELEKNILIHKDLDTGEQKSINLAEFEDLFKNI